MHKEYMKSKKYPCNVCGEDAVACLSPDIDIKGLCFCEKHRFTVYAVYHAIIADDEADIAEMIKDWKYK